MKVVLFLFYFSQKIRLPQCRQYFYFPMGSFSRFWLLLKTEYHLKTQLVLGDGSVGEWGGGMNEKADVEVGLWAYAASKTTALYIYERSQSSRDYDYLSFVCSLVPTATFLKKKV